MTQTDIPFDASKDVAYIEETKSKKPIYVSIPIDEYDNYKETIENLKRVTELEKENSELKKELNIVKFKNERLEKHVNKDRYFINRTTKYVYSPYYSPCDQSVEDTKIEKLTYEGKDEIIKMLIRANHRVHKELMWYMRINRK